MTRTISGRTHVSFLAAVAFSLFSPCAWLVPRIREDVGGAWNLRRLQILAQYGEGPHITSLAFLPLAILFFYKSLTSNRFRYRVLAAVFAGLTVLANAFGAMILLIACMCLLVTVRTELFRRNALTFASVGVLAYAWISPLAPPSVLAAIRLNSPTVEGGYHFTSRSMGGVLIMAAGAAALWWATRRLEAHVRYFTLYAWCLCCIVLLGVFAAIYIVPQPARYQEAMDIGLCMVGVFGGEALLSRWRASLTARWVVASLLLAASLAVLIHDRRYARAVIRNVDIKTTVPYRIAQWMDTHMNNKRVMISGAWSFHFNDFTDTPQLHGGHDPMQPSFLTRIATYTIYTGETHGRGRRGNQHPLAEGAWRQRDIGSWAGQF